MADIDSDLDVALPLNINVEGDKAIVVFGFGERVQTTSMFRTITTFGDLKPYVDVPLYQV
jgi:hypothetical protein